ncbi:PHD-zinc-finger like domain-containing protein, partial [Phlyctochytrium arcticum]
YYVGRILEFVSGKLPGKQTFARIGWYYRPKDVLPGGRGKKHDPRLLLASMHSDINPITSIRGRCRIEHTEHVPDLEQYKQMEDCFYFDQLYDRYTHRVYDVIPLEKVQNIPKKISDALNDYRFILVETGKAADFTESRVCSSCNVWCNPDEAVVKCVGCRGVYHLDCADMAKVPPKGYAWRCAKCNKRMSDANDDTSLLRKVRGQAGMKNDDPDNDIDKPDDDARSRGKAIDGDALFEMEQVDVPEKTHKETAPPMWPFRYFGEYAQFKNMLAEEGPDRGHPKAVSRVGKQYQADLPELEPKPTNLKKIADPEQHDKPIPTIEKPKLADEVADPNDSDMQKKPRPSEVDTNEPDEYPRCGNDELVFKKPDLMTDLQLGAYIERIQEEQPSHVKASDLLFDRALEELRKADYDIPQALKVMLKISPKELNVMEWTEADIKAFEGGVVKFGHDLHLIRREVDKVRAKPMTEIVAFFYRWKKSRRYAAVYAQFCKKHRPGKRFKGQKHAMDGAVDAEGNLSSGDLSEDDMPLAPVANKYRSMECVNCFATESPRWKYRQTDMKKEILCLPCGINHLKYGAARNVSEAVKKANKEVAAAKRPPGKRKRSLDGMGTPPDERRLMKRKQRKTAPKLVLPDIPIMEDYSPSSPEEDTPRPCCVCTDLYEPSDNRIITCTGCKLRVHRGCYGAVDVTELNTFQCARCINIQRPECSLLYRCVLCAIVNSPRESALKRTIGNNWAHVACALWMPELKFGDPETLEPVECIGLIDRKRWKHVCDICQQAVGACLTCSERGCSTSFHATCAQYAGWEMAIEPVKTAKATSTTELRAIAHCPKHDRRSPPSSTDLLKVEETVAALVANSSLHQPAPVSLVPFALEENPDPLQSRPQRVKDFVRSAKCHLKPLKTSGMKRAYSMALPRTCFCHMCEAE